MRKSIIITLLSIILSCPALALAALGIVEHVQELPADMTALPGNEAGQVVFRRCAGCDPTIWTVDANTNYYLGFKTPPVSLANLRAAHSSGNHGMVVVFITPNTDQVTRIVLL